MFQFKYYSMKYVYYYKSCFFLSTIGIDSLNNIWNYFQISFHLVQGFTINTA